MKRSRVLGIVALLFMILAGGAWAIKARSSIPGFSGLAPALSDVPRAPAGVRIRVQVLNTTGTRGLARRATHLLRDRGFDVVEMGTLSNEPRDSTVVLDRSRHPDWAATAAQVLGPAARSESRPDSSRYLDITVLLGASWRPPAEPLDP